MTPAAALPWLLLTVLVLGGCAAKPPAPIEDRSRPGALRENERYVVLRGDTLFSIAFRYGLDFRRLAAANSIAAPYTIFPGQTLRLAEADPPRRVAAASSRPQAKAKTSPAPTAKTATAAAPARQSAPAVSTGKQSAAPTGGAVATASAESNVAVSAWRWPVSGRVVRRFETSLHKGIDISGDRGDPVLASAGGKIVYAGSGIAGYGLMLIIRHNDEYLSAYGHNDALLVDEGEIVRAGQRIAERGSSGTDSVKLHFEIRRNGRPVDPLRLLPPP